ncbi:MAG TPA: T9SS type A sorting domain-containing protein [Chitinophagales bacterium]|nr:T9SS type A sorting domain-containing protein [Chitinophagales bacterium]
MLSHSLRFCALALTAAALTGLIVMSPSRVETAQTEKRMTTLVKKRSAAMDDPDSRIGWETERTKDPATGFVPAGIRKAELAFAQKLPKAPKDRNGFVSRGPFNVGGRTRAFAMDINDPNILIGGSVSGGIYRSTDGGATWTETTVPIFYQGITCLSQDTRPGHTNVWYAGSGEAYGQSASGNGSNSYFLGNGVYKSTDGGVTWDTIPGTSSTTPQTFDLQYELIWSVKTDPSRMDSSVVYCATYGGVYRSNDAGASWKRIKGTFGSASDAYFTDVEVTPTGVVYLTFSDDAGASKGIWRSANGLQFVHILPPSFPAAYNRIVIGYAPSDENQVYFLANTPGFGQPDTSYSGNVEWNSFWKYTHVSGESFGSWEDRSTNLPTTGGPFDKFMVQGSYDMVVTVKPDDPNYVIIGGTNLYRSTDGFATYNNWRMIGGYKEGTMLHIVEGWDNHHPDQHAAFFHPDNYDVLFSGNDGGLFRTDDVHAQNVSWTSLNNGYLTTQFYTLAVDHAVANDPIIIGGLQDNGSWFTNNTWPTHTWVHTRGGDGSFCAIADNKQAYYYSIQLGKMQRAFVDANGNTTSYARIDPRDATGFQFINPFILDPVDNNIMYLPAGHKMWRNDNLAGIPMVNNWDSIMTNWVTLPDTCTTLQGEITAVACSREPAHVLYYGTNKKRLYKVVNANTGSPTRQEITGLSAPVVFPTGYINCIAVDPHDANRVLVVFSNYNIMSLFFTPDGGSTWTRVSGNLEQTPSGSGTGPSCRWASFLHVPDGVLCYVATSTGLYATDFFDGANTQWVHQAPDLIGNAVCDVVVTREADGLVAVGTHGNGVYSANVTSVGHAVGVSGIASRVRDLRVMPNPASAASGLTVSFISAANGPVVFDVLNPTGQVVFSKNASAIVGTQTMRLPVQSEWNAGVYFVRLRHASDSRSVKWVKF